MRRAAIATTIGCALALLGGEAAAGEPELANRCFTISFGARHVAATPDGYRVGENRPAAFHLEPTGLRTYLLHDGGGELLTRAGKRGVRRAERPSRDSEWRLDRDGGAYFVGTPDGRRVLTVGAGASLVQAPFARRGFGLERARGCRPFPEARVGASGRAPRSVNPDGTVFGFVDTHLHITADMRAGGRVIDGKAFDPLGISQALGNDARNHGPDGSADVTGNLLRTGLPFGTHDTDGWPTFDGWPVSDTNTHQQVYYRWLERMWMAGERLVVAQTVEDEPLCRIEPQRSHSCDEMRTVALEVRRLRALERYVDAQSGGRGEGWFRLVYGPAQARRVIERGKLAVLIGVESSGVLGCTESSPCTRSEVDREIDRLKRLGVRSMFIAHWVDNAFSGAALEGGTKGVFINVFEELSTGHYFRTGPCPDPSQGEEVETLGPVEMNVLTSFFPAASGIDPMPDYPDGRQCNVKGLTRLGAYLVRRLMAEHMLIEVDHMSEWARDRVLRMATKRDYPLVSSHTGTGGSWTPAELRTLFASGGFAAATPTQAPALAERILDLRRYAGRGPAQVGLGTDAGGFSSLPGPAESGRELVYPFEGHRGGVRFRRQVSGERAFDLNADGVAHYGLFADLLAVMRSEPGGDRATRGLFSSAEGYLRTWRATR